MVKTTGGSIGFSRELVIQQFDNPEQITDAGLKKAAQLFQSQN
jgi:hypothetical protein